MSKFKNLLFYFSIIAAASLLLNGCNGCTNSDKTMPAESAQEMDATDGASDEVGETHNHEDAADEATEDEQPPSDAPDPGAPEMDESEEEAGSGDV